MRVIRAYWRQASSSHGTGVIPGQYMKVSVDRRVWIDPKAASPTTNYMFIALPLMCNISQACIDVTFNAQGRPTFQPLLYIFSGENVTIDAVSAAGAAEIRLLGGTGRAANIPPAYMLSDPAPRWLELLIGIAHDIYRPYLAAEDAIQALNNTRLYAEHGPLVPSLEPNPQQRLKFVICVSWPEWQLQKLTWAERAFWLQKEGVTLNARDATQNINSLKQICGRWQLKMSDKLI